MENMKFRVLLIEDDRIDQEAFKRFVKKEKLDFEYKVVSSVLEARQTLASEGFDIIITDYSLGDGTADEIFDLIVDTPIIVTTGAGDEDTAVKAMKSGAYDYLIKDLERNYLRILPVTIENAIKHKNAEQELKVLSELHSAVLENTFDSIIVIDFEGTILFANKPLREISKYSEEELINLHLSEITVGEEFVSHIIESAKKGQRFRNLETTMIPKNGPGVPIALSVSSIMDDRKILIVARDLRAEKELSEELEFFRKFSVEHIYTSLFKKKDKTTEAVISDSLPFSKGSSEDFLSRLGIYYTNALPQDKRSSLGLFGPLPVLDIQDYLGLIFSFFISDPLNKDPQNKGISHCFIVFTIPKTFIRLFANRSSITEILEKRLGMIANIYEIDLVFLNSLKYQILDLSIAPGRV
ncbi:MAG: response regulator [Candidatus Hodarchaeota archaeon]